MSTSLFVVSSDVCLQIGIIATCVVTLHTVEWLFTCVCPDVSIKLRLSVEGFATICACVFPPILQHVSLKCGKMLSLKLPHKLNHKLNQKAHCLLTESVTFEQICYIIYLVLILLNRFCNCLE